MSGLNFKKLNAWRMHPSIRPTHPKHIVPGFGTAAALFAVYCAYDWLTAPAHTAVAAPHDTKHTHH